MNALSGNLKKAGNKDVFEAVILSTSVARDTALKVKAQFESAAEARTSEYECVAKANEARWREYEVLTSLAPRLGADVAGHP